MTPYPPKLQAIIDLFSSLPEGERRENLIAYAERAKKHEPKPGDTFALEDIRKDEECTDTVGIFVQLDSHRRVQFKVTLGDKVQTLTRALASILCQGLAGCTLQEVLDLPREFVPHIVGGQLVRIRSQTVYYVLTRMKTACQVLLDRLSAES